MRCKNFLVTFADVFASDLAFFHYQMTLHSIERHQLDNRALITPFFTVNPVGNVSSFR